MGAAVRIRPVFGKRELKRFIMYPWRLYRGPDGYRAWVPPLIIDQKFLLDTRRHPFYKHAEMQCFLAYRQGEIVGRISGIIDQHYVKHRGEKAAYFGFYESLDDEQVACALFETVEDWARERGMEKIVGPISPTPNHILGVLLNDYDNPPVVQVPYNPPYYPDLMEKSGLRKEKDHYAYYMEATYPIADRITRVANIARKRGRFTVRPLDFGRFKEELEYCLEIYNHAWQDNSDFVPWTEEEFFNIAKDMRLICIKDMVQLAFVDGVPAGISLPVLDMNQILIKMNGRLFPSGIFRLLLGKRKIDFFRLMAMGVRPEYQNMGIDAVFVADMYRYTIENGFRGAEFSLVIEDNYKLRNMLESWGAVPYRSYRVYQKEI
jgi:GNAT superfamily N-acetyltransferase